MESECRVVSLKKGALGPAAITFLVISAAGPLVAMAGGIPVAMLFGNGAGLPAMFLVACLILLAFATGYTAMAREVRNAGAFYAFAARGLGGSAAGATGMIALLSYNAIQIGLYGLFGMAAQNLLEPLTHVALPWWVYSLAALGSIAFLGYRQVDLSARILGLLVAGEYIVVLILVAAIVANGGDNGLNLGSFTPHIVERGSPAIGLMLCFSAFIGFEATTIYSEEARDPERTIPRATYFSVLLIGGFYTVATWAVVNGIGIEKLMPILRSTPNPTDLLFSLADRYVGGPLPIAMRVLFVTSAYASLLAFHNAIARYLFAMGREGLLPRILSRTHPRFASPHAGSLTQSVIAILCTIFFAASGADPVLVVFTIPSALATLGIVVLMAISSAAAISFLLRKQVKPVLTIGLTAIACIAFTGISVLAAEHFDLLAGNGGKISALLPWSIPLAGLVGVSLAQMLRARNARGFDALGQNV